MVDEKTGDIVFSFESCQMNFGSKFVWKKDYMEITDFSKGVEIKTEGNTYVKQKKTNYVFIGCLKKIKPRKGLNEGKMYNYHNNNNYHIFVHCSTLQFQADLQEPRQR